MKVLDLLIGIVLVLAIVFFGSAIYEKLSQKQQNQILSMIANSKKEDQTKNLTAEYNRVKDELIELKSKNSKTENENNLLKDKKNFLEKDLLDAQSKYKYLSDQYLEVLKKNESLNKDLSNQKVQIKSEVKIVRDDSLIDSLESKIVSLQLEKESEKINQVDNFNKKIKALEDKITDLLENSGKLKNEKDSLDKDLSICQAQVSTFKEISKKEEVKTVQNYKTQIGQEMNIRQPRSEKRGSLFEPLEEPVKKYKKQPVDPLN